MDLSEAVETIHVSNMNYSGSTLTEWELILHKAETKLYVISEVDHELFIFIEFYNLVDLQEIQLYGLPNDELKQASPPKQIHIHKMRYFDFDSDEIKSLIPNESFKCSLDKLSKGQSIPLTSCSNIKELLIYIESNQNNTHYTYLNHIRFIGNNPKQQTLQSQSSVPFTPDLITNNDNKEDYSDDDLETVFPASLQECSTHDLLFFIRHHPVFNDKIINQFKSKIMRYFRKNQIDGLRIANTKRRAFAENLIEYDNHNKKIRGCANKVYDRLIKYQFPGYRILQESDFMCIDDLGLSNDKMRWNCPDCHYMNQPSSLMCIVCFAPKPPKPWLCPSCTFENIGDASKCEMCNEPKSWESTFTSLLQSFTHLANNNVGAHIQQNQVIHVVFDDENQSSNKHESIDSFNQNYMNIIQDENIYDHCLGDLHYSQCPSILRLFEILRQYISLNPAQSSQNRERFIHLITTEYTNLLNDYIHFIKHHQHEIEEIHEDLVKNKDFKKCNFKSCEYTFRHHRVHERNIDYSQADDIFDFYKETMDSLHCYMLHIFDVGLRTPSIPTTVAIKYEEKSNTKQEDEFFDAKFANLRRKISETNRNTQLFARYKATDNSKFRINAHLNQHTQEESMNGVEQTTDLDTTTYFDVILVKLKEFGVDNDVINSFDEYAQREEYDSESVWFDVSNEGKTGNISKIIKDDKCIDALTKFISESHGMLCA